VSGFFEKFGSIPVGNLAVVLTFVTAVLIAFLLYRRNRDARKVDEAVKRLN